MGISRHAVGTGRPIQRVENLRAIHAEFDTRRFQTGEEAVHVSIEKGPLAVIEPHAFPCRRRAGSPNRRPKFSRRRDARCRRLHKS